MNERRPNLHEMFLNKWTALAAGIITVVGLKLGFNDEQKKELREKVKVSLQEESLSGMSPDAERAKEIVEEVVGSINKNEIAKARKEDADGVKNEIVQDLIGEDEESKEDELVNYDKLGIITDPGSKVVSEGSEGMIIEYVDEDGKEHYKMIDKTLPDHETATDENFSEISKGFAENLPDYNIDRTDQWHYEVTLKEQPDDFSQFRVSIQVMDDGRYLIGSASTTETEIYVNSLDEVYEMIKLKLEILETSEKISGDKEWDEFREYLKSKGLFPVKPRE